MGGKLSSLTGKKERVGPPTGVTNANKNSVVALPTANAVEAKKEVIVHTNTPEPKKEVIVTTNTVTHGGKYKRKSKGKRSKKSKSKKSKKV